MYTATHHKTGAIETWNEEQVRAEVIDTYQHEMGIVFGEGLSDEEIAASVMSDDINAHFDTDGSFDGRTYMITRKGV